MRAITSRKHKPMQRRAGATTLAMLMLPFAAHAAGQAEQAAQASPAAATVPAGAPQDRGDDEHAHHKHHGDRDHEQDGDDDDRDHPHRVQVVGARDNDFKADHAQSAKYTEKLVDTPQSVIVIKKELFEQQGATTLTEALRNTPGVGTFFLGENGSTNTGDAIYMRGFDTSGSIFVDGVRDIGSISRDIFNIEQVDVLKGPAGTDTGRSAPTGSINLVSKQPLSTNTDDASLTGGSAHQRRGTADLNHVLDEHGDVALRVNLLDQDSGDPARDEVRNKRWAIAPSLAIGLKGPTRLYLDYLHVKQDNRPDGGVPTIGLPGYTSPDATRPFLSTAAPVDPSNYYGSDADFDHVTADMFTAILEHDFRDGMKLRSTTRYGKTRELYVLTSFMGTAANIVTPSAANPAGWTLARANINQKDQENTVVANQTTLTSEFATGALRHTLVSGLDLVDEKQSNVTLGGLGTLQTESLYAPNPFLPISGRTLAPNGARSQGESVTESGYLLDTIKLGERWIFGASVRVDHYNTTYDAITLATAAANPTLPLNTPVPSHIEVGDNLVSGKISALYKPTENSSVYALWANSKNPPGSSLSLSTGANSASNPIYQPEVSTTTEVGAKWDLLRQKLSLTAALYRTDVKNDVEQDPVTPTLYYQTGRKRVQGIEVGMTGEVTRNWLVSAGYTYMDTSVEAGKIETAAGATDLAYTPRNAFTSWTSYTLPFGLKLGGGLRYQGRLLRGTDGAIGTPAYADSYWVTDAMAEYRINRYVDLRLNVYNIFNREYVASINKSGYRYTPGAPRWGSLTADFHF